MRVASQAIGRRSFLIQAGRGVLGVAVLGLAACDNEPGDAAEPGRSSSAPGSTDATTTASDGVTTTAALTWARVDLGFVSAYVLVRGGEAAVVDTGVGGSADQIGAVLDDAGPGWAGVRHVVLTHKHDDHAGSLGDVAERASDATLYAGAADLDAIDAPRRMRALADGDDVFGLQMVATPGHTPGHVAVFDADSAVLVAGDALNNNADRLSGASPRFTEDEAAAADSVRKLAELQPRVILVGHGPPVERGAAAALQSLAASLA
jgi:glyoxylase-like metal-dependent hydrolase (beta-lactamase superfamily II)